MSAPFERVAIRSFALWAVIAVVVLGVALAVLQIELDSAEWLILVGGIGQLLMLAWALVYTRRSGMPVAAFFAPRPSILRVVRNTPLLLLHFAGSVAGIYVVYYPLSFEYPELVEGLINQVFVGQNSTTELAAIYILVVVVGPIIEELVFRGIFFQRIARKWGTTTGLLVSSIFFGFGHADVLGAALFGATLCIVYLRTGSLWILVILHVLNNALWMILENFVDPSVMFVTADELQSEPWIGIVAVVITVVAMTMYVRRNRDAIAAEPPMIREKFLEPATSRL